MKYYTSMETFCFPNESIVMGGADTKYSIFLIRETNRLKTFSELSESFRNIKN